MRWETPKYKAIHEMLTNPVYAGAYAYGRKRTERRVEDGVIRERQRRAPREDWHVCIPEHHPGYISFERTSPTSSGCAPTGARRAARAAAPPAKAARCCKA